MLKNQVIECIYCRCQCDEGYTGKNCESAYIPCDPSPCQNRGLCTPEGNFNYSCSCPAGNRPRAKPNFNLTTQLSICK